MRTNENPITGQTVVVSHENGSARAQITGVRSDGGAVQLQFSKIPGFYQRLLRRRGIFMHPDSGCLVNAFRTHDRKWCDVQTMAVFEILAIRHK